MDLECKKVENCFQDSQTYEYRLPVQAQRILDLLEDTWAIRCNEKLRRPVFLAERDGIHIRAALAGSVIRVSFPDPVQAQQKERFEYWLNRAMEGL